LVRPKTQGKSFYISVAIILI